MGRYFLGSFQVSAWTDSCNSRFLKERQMKKKDKTKERLLEELRKLHKRVEKLERISVERERLENQLRKLSSVTEQTDDSVVVTDRNGVIEYVNPAFERKTGYGKEEAIGRFSRIVKSGKQGEDFYKQLWETILRGEVFRGVLINKKKNGELYYEEKTITPLRNGEGVVTHYVSTGKDITERKEMEAELERALIGKERLEAIRSLSMTYAHNIFNAITPVKSYAEMILKRTDPSDPKHAWAQSILNGTTEVVKIVNKLKEIEAENTTEFGGMRLLDLDRLKEEPGR